MASICAAGIQTDCKIILQIKEKHKGNLTAFSLGFLTFPVSRPSGTAFSRHFGQIAKKFPFYDSCLFTSCQKNVKLKLSNSAIRPLRRELFPMLWPKRIKSFIWR